MGGDGVTAGHRASAGLTTIVWIGGVLGVMAIGAVDYASGVELRVFPLYYPPIAVVAWYRGRRGAIAIAALSTATWVFSNYLADLRFSSASIWVVNSLMQAASFAVMGILIARISEALRQERTLSRTDPLTGLLNSRAFLEEGTRLLALCRRNGRPITLAYLDLDDFKAVNDRLGHQVGDDVLRLVGDVLRDSVRPSDVAARMGGDEFAILLPELSFSDAQAAVERVRTALAARATTGGASVKASIGAISFQSPPESVEDLVRRADATMYRAKSAGKDQLLLETSERIPSA